MCSDNQFKLPRKPWGCEHGAFCLRHCINPGSNLGQFTMLKTCGNWLGFVNSCVYCACQTHEICQVLPYSVDFKGSGELWYSLDMAVLSNCSFVCSVRETTSAHQLLPTSVTYWPTLRQHFLYKYVLNTSQNVVIGWCCCILFCKHCVWYKINIWNDCKAEK